jgi:hypothetical protein
MFIRLQAMSFLGFKAMGAPISNIAVVGLDLARLTAS